MGLLLLLAMGFVFYIVFLALAAWLVVRDNKALHRVGRLLAIAFLVMAFSGTVWSVTLIYSEGLGWFVSALLLLNIYFAFMFGLLTRASGTVCN